MKQIMHTYRDIRMKQIRDEFQKSFHSIQMDIYDMAKIDVVGIRFSNPKKTSFYQLMPVENHEAETVAGVVSSVSNRMTVCFMTDSTHCARLAQTVLTQISEDRYPNNFGSNTRIEAPELDENDDELIDLTELNRAILSENLELVGEEDWEMPESSQSVIII